MPAARISSRQMRARRHLCPMDVNPMFRQGLTGPHKEVECIHVIRIHFSTEIAWWREWVHRVLDVVVRISERASYKGSSLCEKSYIGLSGVLPL